MAPLASLSRDDATWISLAVGGAIAAAGWIWRAAKVHSRLVNIERDLADLRAQRYLTEPQHDQLQRICQSELRQQWSTDQREAYDRLLVKMTEICTTMAALGQQVQDIHGNCVYQRSHHEKDHH